MTFIETEHGLGLAAPVICVALVNDYEVVVRGLAHMFAGYGDRVRVVELDVNTTPGQQVDITLYDTFASPVYGDEQLAQIIANPRSGRVVIYSWDLLPGLIEGGLPVGVSGFVPKSATSSDLVTALVRVHAGEDVIIEPAPTPAGPQPSEDSAEVRPPWPGHDVGLSHREAEVLALIAQGLSNQDIADQCYLSPNTIKSYIRSAYRRIGVDTRSQAVIWALRHGMEQQEAAVRFPIRTAPH